MPKVSVIVPNYNHARFLNQRIDSILNQTYTDFELILLDDCSTDESREVLLSYKGHPQVTHVVFNEKNSSSTFKQWEKGIKLAQGEYIWIAESDDWAETDFLTVLTTLLDVYPEAGLAYCNSSININGEKTGDFANEKAKKFHSNHWVNDYCIDGLDEINQVLLKDCTINNASAVLMRKSVLLDIFPFPYPFTFSGDWYCYLRIAAVSQIAYTHSTLNNYREHASNVSKKAGFDYLIELFYIYNWLKKHKIVKSQVCFYRAFHSYVSDVYSTGLEWNVVRDFTQLRPISQKLYVVMTFKLLRRKIRRSFFRK